VPGLNIARMDRRVITIELLAPAKPAHAARCNGCGICCLSEPCPLGMLVSLRRHGRCKALRWHQAPAQYRCGLVGAAVTSQSSGAARAMALPARIARHLVRRWIAAGKGCDSTAVAEAAQP
jgi:hypothetical protein